MDTDDAEYWMVMGSGGSRVFHPDGTPVEAADESDEGETMRNRSEIDGLAVCKRPSGEFEYVPPPATLRAENEADDADDAEDEGLATTDSGHAYVRPPKVWDDN